MVAVVVPVPVPVPMPRLPVGGSNNRGAPLHKPGSNSRWQRFLAALGVRRPCSSRVGVCECTHTLPNATSHSKFKVVFRIFHARASLNHTRRPPTNYTYRFLARVFGVCRATLERVRGVHRGPVLRVCCVRKPGCGVLRCVCGSRQGVA